MLFLARHRTKHVNISNKIEALKFPKACKALFATLKTEN